MIRLVESDGWRHVRTTGSHRHYKHPRKPNVVTIPGHPGDEVPRGTLKSIFRAAGLVSTGRTMEETERNIREAIRGHLKTLKEFGEPVPEPTSVAREIEIPPA